GAGPSCWQTARAVRARLVGQAGPAAEPPTSGWAAPRRAAGRSQVTDQGEQDLCALGIELAGGGVQAAVDVNGDHAVAGAEAAGDGNGGGEVGAGRWPGEYAIGASGLARGLERPGFGNGHDFVVVGGVELGWPAADAAALDVMGPWRPARQD